MNQEAKVSCVAKLSTIDPNPMVPKPSQVKSGPRPAVFGGSDPDGAVTA